MFYASFLIFAFIGVVSANDVFTKIACEPQELKLDCRRGEFITIISANYGRTSSAVCSYQKNTDCRDANALDIVKSKCNGQPTCTVMATNNVFGNPCGSTEKYLEVQYSCELAPPCPEFKCDDGQCITERSVCNGIRDCTDGEDELGCYYYTAHGCEQNNLNIECRKGEIIRILHGDYGRTNPLICKIDHKPYCVSPVADSIIKDRCDLRRSCSMPVNNEFFGNPCEGTSKYATAHYTCLKLDLPPIYRNIYNITPV